MFILLKMSNSFRLDFLSVKYSSIYQKFLFRLIILAQINHLFLILYPIILEYFLVRIPIQDFL